MRAFSTSKVWLVLVSLSLLSLFGPLAASAQVLKATVKIDGMI